MLGVPLHPARATRWKAAVSAANLTRVGEKDNYDYLVRWVHNARERTRPYCMYEKKDIGPEDYAKKGLPYVFDLEHSRCPNDGHELQVQNMTVMPSLRLSPQDAEDVASYLVTLKKQEPSAYPDAAFMADPNLKEEGKKWIRHFGCAGCHEISGMEDEGRIGTELTFEGSKPIERLDFALLTEVAQRGGSEPIVDPMIWRGCRKVLRKGRGTTTKDFSSINLPSRMSGTRAKSSLNSKNCACRICTSPKEQVQALTTFLMGSEESASAPELSIPALGLSARYSRGLVGSAKI